MSEVAVNSDISIEHDLLIEVQPDLEEESEEDETVLFQPGSSDFACPNCPSFCNDLGLENADEFSPEKRWYRCPNCGYLTNIITGPPAKPRELFDFAAFNKRCHSNAY